MSEDQADPTLFSRRALLAVAGAAPVVCAVGSAPTAPLIGRCAQWLTLDFESDHLARRWAALETEAVAGFDYFRMNDRERRGLPMGPEMEAIEKQLDDLFSRRKRLYRAITKMTPANVHEAASLIVIAARIEIHDPGPTAPLVRKAMDFIAQATCPHCGEAYVLKEPTHGVSARAATLPPDCLSFPPMTARRICLPRTRRIAPLGNGPSSAEASRA